MSGLSGAARLIIAHAAAASAAGWAVTAFGERLDRAALREAGAHAVRVPAWPWGSWLKRRVFAALAGRWTRGFDLVHGHGDLLEQDVLSLHNGVHAAHEAAWDAPLPASDAVGRLHSLQLRERRFRRLIVNSNLLRDDVLRRFGVPAEQVSVIRPGFDPARFRPQDRARLRGAGRAELGLSSDSLLVGLVTSGDFEKRGLPAFLRAFAAVARERPLARALVVGRESRLGRYRQLGRELGIAEKLLFRDPIFEVERYYHSLDLYVHAARWEEFGMSVLEALACGLPVLTGGSVGAAELLSGEARQQVLSEPSPEALAAAMLALARDPERRARLGGLGPAAAAPCAWSKVSAATLALYEQVLETRPIRQKK